MALIKISVFTYDNSLSTQFHHPCHSLSFDRDHLRFNMAMRSFPLQDHFRSNLGIICGPGSLAVLGSFADPYGSNIVEHFAVHPNMFESVWPLSTIPSGLVDKQCLIGFGRQTFPVWTGPMSVTWFECQCKVCKLQEAKCYN